jgi:hypothetical protein
MTSRAKQQWQLGLEHKAQSGHRHATFVSSTAFIYKYFIFAAKL